MIVKEVFSDILLGLAVLIVLTSAIGVLVMRDAYQKLHFVSPAGLVAPALVALAVMVQHGVYENTGETFLALFFMIIAGPLIAGIGWAMSAYGFYHGVQSFWHAGSVLVDCVELLDAVAQPLEFVCEEDVRLALKTGKKLVISERAIVTPAARDLGEQHRVFSVAPWRGCAPGGGRAV